MTDHPPPSADATALLQRASEGDSEAANDLFPLVYAELRARAGAQFRGQPADHTLEPTALVHEAYVKMIRSADARWNSRAHFVAIASSAMRQILIDHARRRQRAKGALDEFADRPTLMSMPSRSAPVDLLALEDALVKLESLNPERARIVELRFFGGLSNDEVAAAVGVSSGTIVRQWRHTKAWLAYELGSDRQAED